MKRKRMVHLSLFIETMVYGPSITFMK